MQNEQEVPNAAATTDSQEYEAPAIESVVTADELTREVHYAGAPDATIIFIA